MVVRNKCRRSRDTYTYFSWKSPTCDGVLGTGLIAQTEMQRHLTPFVAVRKRTASHVHTRLAAVVHRKDDTLAHVA